MGANPTAALDPLGTATFESQTRERLEVEDVLGPTLAAGSAEMITAPAPSVEPSREAGWLASATEVRERSRFGTSSPVPQEAVDVMATVPAEERTQVALAYREKYGSDLFSDIVRNTAPPDEERTVARAMSLFQEAGYSQTALIATMDAVRIQRLCAGDLDTNGPKVLEALRAMSPDQMESARDAYSKRLNGNFDLEISRLLDPSDHPSVPASAYDEAVKLLGRTPGSPPPPPTPEALVDIVRFCLRGTFPGDPKDYRAALGFLENLPPRDLERVLELYGNDGAELGRDLLNAVREAVGGRRL